MGPDLTRYFGQDNYANYTNGEVNSILRELYSISDEKILKKKYQVLQNLYEQDRPYIGLYFNRITSVYGKTLVATVNDNWFNMFYNIADWHKKG